MAGGSVTAADDVLALGLQGEVFVEGRNAIEPGLAYADGLCHVGEDFLGEVMIEFLNILQNGDGGTLVLGIFFQNLIDLCKIKCFFHTHSSVRNS